MQSIFAQVEQAEHIWCQAKLESKKEILAFGTALTKVGRRQKYDCRTQEAKVQQAVYKLYEPLFAELDARIASRSNMTRICPYVVAGSAISSSFETLCADHNGVAKQYLVDTLGQSTFDKFEHRFIK